MIVLCSGGFDPLHLGHLNYLREASKLGSIIVALNSDAWLVRKKGYVFMPWEERAEIVGSLYCVLGAVIRVDDDDETVCSALLEFKPGIYANGGDRTEPQPKEDALCEELGIRQVFGIGGGKTHSSSDLVAVARI